jgi:hypothetical protein
MSRFELETASSGERVRGQCSIAIHKNNSPRIAYTVETGEVMIASRDTGTWVREQPFGPLAAAGDEDRVWLQMDSAGNPHLAYIEEGTRRLIYGVRGPDLSWSFEAVPTHRPPHEPGVYSISFALHPGGWPGLLDTPHFAFEDQSADNLSYVRKVDGAWKLNLVAMARDFGDAGHSRTGQYTSLCFNESGSLQIAYVETYEVVPTTVVHVKRVLDVTGDTFGAERDVESGQFVTGQTSIISHTPETWVAYCDLTNDELKAGTFNSDNEAVVEVIDTIASRTVPVLAQDPTVRDGLFHRLRIAYTDGEGKIKLARRSVDDWTVEVVDSDVGKLPCLTYDSRGHAHMAYGVGQTLRYVKGQPQ